MLREALTYPFRAAEQTLLVGTILAVLAGLLARLGILAVLAVVPAVLLAGYALAVLRESTGSEDGPAASADGTTTDAGGASADAPPAFADVPSPQARTVASLLALAADGVRALVVAVGYLAVPSVALVVTVGGSASGGSATAGTSLFILGAGTVVLLTSMVFVYLMPAALVAVARTRTLRNGFALGRLRASVTDARYFLGWVTALSVVGISALLFDVLGSLGRPGEVAALALGFYATVVVARLLGRSTGP